MAEKITIFKEVFDSYYDGELTKEQFADLMLLHYQVMWGNGVELEDIKDNDIKKIWRYLQYTVKKSAKNARDYQKRKENENKAVLTPLNPQDDNLYQPEVEMPSNSLKIANTEVFEIEEGLSKFLTEYKFKIEDIINAYNSGSPLKIEKQGNGGLKELLNTYYGRLYKEDIIRIIQNKTQYKITA